MRVLFSKGIISISKPRCGSTSIRLMLDPFVSKKAGDIRVNAKGDSKIFHPHITAPYLEKVLNEMGEDYSALSSFITIRHPIEMLWSYYKYFKPDRNSKYSFSQRWDQSNLMEFERWVSEGSVGSNPEWMRLGPKWISTSDLSPLSLEAYAMNHENRLIVDHIFRIERASLIADWISERVGQQVEIIHTNQSNSAKSKKLGIYALDRVRRMFPFESRVYGI